MTDALLAIGVVSVDTAATGQQAYKKFLAHGSGNYDCIIMDLWMDGVVANWDGLQTTHMIRLFENENTNVRCIVIFRCLLHCCCYWFFCVVQL